jgi:hypothetical protein
VSCLQQGTRVKYVQVRGLYKKNKQNNE